MLEAFDEAVKMHFEPQHLAAGGFEVAGRTGEVMFFPLTSLSVGVIKVAPGRYLSHHEIGSATAEAKKMAKKAPGSSLFVERRQPVPGRGMTKSGAGLINSKV